MVGSEKLADAKSLTIDEAKKKLKLFGDKAEAFEKKISEREDGQFNLLMSIVFGKKLQEDGSRKLMSKMPSGKALFPDRSESLEEIEPGIPYVCLVYDRELNEKGEPGREAFAKIICKEYQPIIYVPATSRIPVLVYTKENGETTRKAYPGKSYAERMMALLNESEKLGFPSVKIVYRKNQIRE